MEPSKENQTNTNKYIDDRVTPSETGASFPGERQRGTIDGDINMDIIQDVSKNKTPEIEKDEKKGIAGNTKWRIRTYKEDIAEAVRSQKASLTSVVAAEQIRRSKLIQNIKTDDKTTDFKKLGIIFGSIILVVFGIAVIGYFAFFYERKEVIIDREVPSLIFTEKQKEVNITNKNAREILQTLGAEKDNSTLPLGQMSYLYPTKTERLLEIDVTRLISAEEFLTSIRAQVSNAFLRSLEPSFMVGIHVFNQNQPFIIFNSNSYQHSFNGLLEWERVMYQNLSLFMGRKADSILGVPTNPQTGEEVVLRENFEDIIIKNIDVRALLSEAGDIELLYAFPNQQTLIITTNKNTLIEIITRLNSVRVF